MAGCLAGEPGAGAKAGRGALSGAIASPEARALCEALLPALGGLENVRTAEPCARTRVRVVLLDPSLLDEPALLASGVAGVARLAGGVVHLVFGEDADALADALRDVLQGTAE
jgi:phosphotransferase system IIB component